MFRRSSRTWRLTLWYFYYFIGEFFKKSKQQNCVIKTFIYSNDLKSNLRCKQWILQNGRAHSLLNMNDFEVMAWSHQCCTKCNVFPDQYCSHAEIFSSETQFAPCNRDGIIQTFQVTWLYNEMIEYISDPLDKS